MSFKYFKGTVSFELDKKAYHFQDLDITSEGVPELCKYNDNLSFKLNRIISVKVKSLFSFHTFTVKSKLYINNDANSKNFGLIFVETSNDFKSFIDKNGKPFSKWTRNTPRINYKYFEEALENFEIELSLSETNQYIKLHLLNVSLGGFGIYGSVKNTSFLKINSLVDCKFTAKNSFYFTARVVRITTISQNDSSGNQIYINHIGLKFVNFDEANKKLFLDTVNEIIKIIKK